MGTPKLRQAGLVDVTFDGEATVIQPANLYGCRIGDGVFVGPFVEIQRGVVVGKGTRVQSHSFVCELVTIGERCFVGHGVMFINDAFSEGGPAYGQPEKWKPTVIEDDVSIGSNATLLPVRVASGCVIGAGAVVTKDCTVKGVYAGNPARLIRKLP